MRFRLRLIPATLVVTTLVGGVKLGQLCSVATTLIGVPTAVAKTADATHTTTAALHTKAGPARQGGAPVSPAPTAVLPTTAPAAPPLETAPAVPAATLGDQKPAIPTPPATAKHAPRSFNNPTQFSRADISLLQDLTKRRQALDRREQALDMREKLIAAMSKRLDAKIAEMKTLQASLKTLMAQRQAEHSQRIRNLIEVYQNMKPQSAARIFSRLQMPILLQVVAGMSQHKLAPILAAMDPSKVQMITTELATEPGPVTGAGSSSGPGAPNG